MGSSTLIVIALLILAPADLAWATPDAVTRFQLARDGMILVPVAIGNAGPFTFILDTGSNGSAISESLWERLGLPLAGKGLTSSSTTGQKPRLFVRLNQVRVGLARANELMAGVVADKDLDPTGAAQGIVGQDVLLKLRYTIDYGLGAIEWAGISDASPKATVLTLEAHDDRLLALLPQAESTLRLVPDSGARALVLFQRNGHRLPAMRPVQGRFVLTTLTGSREVGLNLVDELRVGATRLRNQPAVVLGADPGVTSADGLLPLHVFERVTLDGPRGMMIVETKSR